MIFHHGIESCKNSLRSLTYIITLAFLTSELQSIFQEERDSDRAGQGGILTWW
jgi:hypothetical protein